MKAKAYLIAILALGVYVVYMWAVLVNVGKNTCLTVMEILTVLEVVVMAVVFIRRSRQGKAGRALMLANLLFTPYLLLVLPFFMKKTM
jgi:hypothetical protein